MKELQFFTKSNQNQQPDLPHLTLIKCLIMGLMVVLCLEGNGQVGVQTETPDASSMLDISGSDKGLLIPRISLTEDLTNPAPVSDPANGLLVFNIGADQVNGFYYWSGSQWLLIQSPTADTLSGPGTSNDEAIVRFDGNSGKLVQNSLVTIDDAANIANLNYVASDLLTITSDPGVEKILTSDINGNGTWQYPEGMEVKKSNSTIVNNARSLNFAGGNTLRDEGNNKVSVAFYRNSVTRDLIQLSSGDSLDLNDLNNPVAVPWDIEIERNPATFNHSGITNSSRIYVRVSGIYEINYIINTISKTIQRKTLRIRTIKNGSEILNYSVCYSFSYNMADFQSSHNSSSFLVTLNQGDYIELIANGQTNPGPLLMVSNENVFFMRLLRPL